MSKYWYIENDGPVIETRSGERYRHWLVQGYSSEDSSEDSKIYGELFEVYAKVSHSKKFVALNFARFMRRNPHWEEENPIDFRYVTEEIGGTNNGGN